MACDYGTYAVLLLYRSAAWPVAELVVLLLAVLGGWAVITRRSAAL